MSRIDKKLLLEEADAREVAEYIGMDVQKKGANYFVLCPGHKDRLGKDDITIGNCVLYKNGYKCFACDPNKIVDIYQMVQEFTGCTFPEALETVAEIYGGASLFQTNANPEEQPLPLSAEDLKILGLKKAGKMHLPVNTDTKHFEPSAGFKLEKVKNLYQLSESETTFTLVKFRRENPEIFDKLIKTKAKEMYQKYNRAIKEYCTRTSLKSTEVYDLFEEDGYVDDAVFFGLENAFRKKAQRCLEIYKEFCKEKEPR